MTFDITVPLQAKVGVGPSILFFLSCGIVLVWIKMFSNKNT